MGDLNAAEARPRAAGRPSARRAAARRRRSAIFGGVAVLIVATILPAWRYLLARDLREAEATEGGRASRAAPIWGTSEHGVLEAPVDATRSMLTDLFAGELIDLDAVTTPRMRTELRESEGRLPDVDLEQARVLRRIRGSVQIEAPLRDGPERPGGPTHARLRLVKDPEDGTWKLDHVRTEGETSHGQR